jgi:hypothetical protein
MIHLQINIAYIAIAVSYAGSRVHVVASFQWHEKVV